MSRDPDFRSTVASLWFRLITLAIIALVFSEAVFLAQGKAQGWTYYLTAPEVVFEVVVRLVAAALAGVAAGTICTAAIAPFLWHFKSSREHVAEVATKITGVLVVFLVSWFALEILIKWRYHWTTRGARFDSVVLLAFYLAFAAALFIPRARRELATSLDGFLGEKMTRRTAIATVIGTAALVVTEFALSKTAPTVKAALAPQRPRSNFLLITFDALNAEDMSLYGRTLPTTPNLDAFAGKGTVFSNFFSSSTFTTASVASILTGMYPSENHVYHLTGQVRPQNARKSLPHVMRGAGYATGAFASNPYAYYLAKNLENEFDVLPEPTFQQGGLQHLWDATLPLHQDSGFGSRMDEYRDLIHPWNFVSRVPIDLALRFRPDASFEHARRVLAKLPDGFFMWIHVMTPHYPYLPDSADRGRFLPDAGPQSFQDEPDTLFRPHYEPNQQSQVDQHRLGYDEFIASADRAFGTFMSELEQGGKLQNTTVIVSADHGESFEGGVYNHRNPDQTRPVIHVPLIIRTPDQQENRTIVFAADQTALAPTILELAGQPIPDWMRGRSLVEWLNRDGKGEGEGLAFTQYLEKNSVFAPLRHGTVGVIDGQFQYVLDLETQKGTLRPLNEAQIWNLDRAAENPARAEALRTAIYARFPELDQKPT